MKIGFLTRYTKQDIKLAKRVGFQSIQLLCWPGDPLNPAKTTKDKILRAKDDLAANDLEVSAIGSYGNCLDPKERVAKANQKHLVGLMDLCELMEVDTLCTFAGRDPEKDIPDNIPAFKKVFKPIAKKAEDRGIKIGFENCPMFHYFPFRGVNIAYCPRAWDLMFDAVPSPALGLEYDPSHLICMLMDYIEPIYQYGDKIFHVHAKDAEVIWRNVKVNGILEPESVRHRVPGLGQADWSQIISALREVGYQGNLDIEGRHDPVLHGEYEEEGLVIAFKHLSQFVG